jgi:hypothetical protein
MRALTAVCLGAAWATSGCSRATAAAGTTPATTAASPAVLLPPATDLTGSWSADSGAEPLTATIRLNPPCTYHPPVWVVQQTGNQLEVWAFPARYEQGIAVKGTGVARTAAWPGYISGIDVRIDDGETRYELRYDSASTHLRGSRNGRPFWAVRQVVARTGGCPGVP